jgi:hypothetical protein
LIVTQRFVSNRAGRSAQRRYRALAKQWRRRVLGKRTLAALYTALALSLLVITNLHLSSRPSLWAGLVWGMLAMGVWMMPDALMPGHISNWQMGAWGEQNTASELRSLKRHGWVVRNDVQWGSSKGNHDHVLAGPGVYVLNTKNVRDSSVEVDSHALRVRPLENPDGGYLADRWAPQVEREAESLARSISRSSGIPVHVYPVIVVWGVFEAGQTWLGNVCVVRGDQLSAWLLSRPRDILAPEKQKRVQQTVRELPHAS